MELNEKGIPEWKPIYKVGMMKFLNAMKQLKFCKDNDLWIGNEVFIKKQHKTKMRIGKPSPSGWHQEFYDFEN